MSNGVLPWFFMAYLNAIANLSEGCNLSALARGFHGIRQDFPKKLTDSNQWRSDERSLYQKQSAANMCAAHMGICTSTRVRAHVSTYAGLHVHPMSLVHPPCMFTVHPACVRPFVLPLVPPRSPPRVPPRSPHRSTPRPKIEPHLEPHFLTKCSSLISCTNPRPPRSPRSSPCSPPRSHSRSPLRSPPRTKVIPHFHI